MKSFTHLIFTVICTFFAFAKPAEAQSVLNPNDPVINYDSLNPPAQPPWGQIGKWVRRPSLTWDTDSYKAYIYKGLQFRLKFPKSYVPGVNDGKKYPILMFWHGLLEAGDIHDNEYSMFLGGDLFRHNVDNGTFDGYVIFMQAPIDAGSFFAPGHFQFMTEIIDYMVVNNKLDPFRIISNGLSSGGMSTWDIFLKHPNYVSTVIAMSAPGDWSGSDVVEKSKFTPIWYAHGGEDSNPSPTTGDNNYNAMMAAGANFKRIKYPGAYHDTWGATWWDPEFWPYVNRAYSANPWALFNKTLFAPGETVSATIGLAPGYDQYEWRRNGVIIPGATSNSITVNQLGVYDARIRRGTVWSDWSKIPVELKEGIVTPPPPPPPGSATRIEAESFTTMSGIQSEPTSDAGGGLNIGWQDNGDWLNYSVNVETAGTYTLSFRVASPFVGPQFQLRKADGTVITTVTVPNTGGFQNWQTVTALATLPAGQQTLRIITTQANGGWNFNWWEIPGTPNGGTPANQPPTANAGTNQTITLPVNSVNLSGSGSDADGTIASYSWTKVSGPAGESIGAPSQAQTTVSNLAEGSYTFRLTVTDNAGATGSADVVVTVNPATTPPPPPVSGIKIEAEHYTTMSGIQTEPTSDAGGGLNVGWQDTGDWMDYSVNLSSAGSYGINFRVASYFTGAQFQLRNAAGTILATLTVPHTGSFQTWTTISTNVNLPAGPQTLRVYTSNANGGWNFNWFEIAGGSTGTNQAPSANAGADQNITLPSNSVTLSGSGTDPDGSITSYAWTKVSGPSGGNIASPSQQQTAVNNLAEGSYVFRLTVTDNAGATATDDVTVVVSTATTPPVASIKIEAEHYSNMSGIQTEPTSDAGGGLNVGWQDTGDWMDYSVNLSGAGSYTVNFRVASYFTGAQFQLRNSAGTVLATLTVPNTGSFQNWTTISGNVNLPAGQQTLRIYTSNANGGWNINWWEIAGGSTGTTNLAPTANAGSDQTITLPESSVTLSGSGTDSDGNIVSYSWSKVSGPSGGSIGSPSQQQTSVSNLAEGSYTFRLTVTDDDGATATDHVIITVNPAPVTFSAKIEAEDYTSMSGVQTVPTMDAGGGLNVSGIDEGNWMNYSVNIPVAGTYTVNFRVAAPNNGSQLQLRNASGVSLATVNFSKTNSSQIWKTVSASVSLPAGLQTLRIHATKSNGGWSLNWWEIQTPSSGAAVNNQFLPIEQETNGSNDVEIYPNPVRDQIGLIVNNSLTGKLRLQLMDASGQMVKEVHLDKSGTHSLKTKIPATGLRPGIYILRAVMDGWTKSVRVMKQ